MLPPWSGCNTLLLPQMNPALVGPAAVEVMLPIAAILVAPVMAPPAATPPVEVREPPLMLPVVEIEVAPETAPVSALAVMVPPKGASEPLIRNAFPLVPPTTLEKLTEEATTLLKPLPLPVKLVAVTAPFTSTLNTSFAFAASRN